MIAQITDEQLVLTAQKELPYVTRSYEELLSRYETLVYRTCYSFLRKKEEAEEASQDVFLRVFHSLKKFEGRASFKTWLFRITSNLCMTYRSKLARERERLEKVQGEVEEDSRLPKVSRSEKDAMREKIDQALDKLKEDERQIMILRHLSQLSVKEVAEALNIGLSAAKMRLKRAQEKFKDVYERLAILMLFILKQFFLILIVLLDRFFWD